MSALCKILVVDDDPVVGKSYDRVLTAKGYSVVTAHDAGEALQRLHEAEVDLVVTDIRMPGMNGLELAETLHARRPWTPVLIVTGFGNEADEARAKAAGVRAFMHKPLSPEMIEASTEQALREAAPVAEAALELPAAPAPEAVAEAPVRESRIKNIALFFAAPFIGLAYAVLMPFAGLAALAWFGARAALRSGALKFAATALAAPFVGLAFIIALPFAGLATLAWLGGRRVIAGTAPSDRE